MTRQYILIPILLISFLLVGCAGAEPDDTVDTEDTELVEETGVIEDTEDGFNSVLMNTGEVELIVVPDAEPSSDEADAGELELNITFQNITDEEITLDFASDDYIVMADGIALTPVTISDELVNPVIPANGTISGDADYTVESGIATYMFTLEGFEAVEIDAEVDQLDD